MSKKFNQYQIMVDGREVEISRYMPEHPTSEVPIVIAPGWTATYPLIENTLHKLTKLKRPIYAIIHSRVKDKIDAPDGFDRYQVAKADNILGVIEDLSLSEVDLIAHSSGSIDASLAAHLQPDVIRSLTLISPAGFCHNTSLPRFYLRSLIKIWDDTTQSLFTYKRSTDTYKYHYSQGRKYVFSNPLHTLKELNGINKANIEPLLEDIRKKGIYVSVLAGDRDAVFPVRELITNAKPAVDFFKVVQNGWHDAVLFHPERYRSLLNDVLKIVDLAADYRRSNKGDVE